MDNSKQNNYNYFQEAALEENKNLEIIKETLKLQPKFVEAMRFFFKGGGNLFDFKTSYPDAMTMALRAAKADGEQNVLAFLDMVNKNNNK